tara:strand:- start:1334 stop:1558 length:225 start_codon:yes stop_codon:yes gene_type:complete
MPLPPDLSKPIFTLMPHLADRIIDNRCAVCCSPISPDEFKNDLSKKEYSISGMCQKCQDAIFGVEEEEEEGMGM